MLTALQIEHIKPAGKIVRLFDDRGLYLEVSPTGRRWWRFKYQFARKEKRVSLGTYPDVSLKEAREKRDEARKQVAAGIDPIEVRRKAKLTQLLNQEHTFEAIAREWHTTFLPTWKPEYAQRIMERLEADAFPWLGPRPINNIAPVDVLAVMRRTHNRGALETAHRIQQYCGKIFRYAVATGRAERDVTTDLRGALPPSKEKHHATIVEPREVGALMRAVKGYHGEFITRSALYLLALTFVRPGELRHAEWTEIDFEQREWRIPAERMKMKARHIIPLSRQALTVLLEIQALTGRFQYVFTGLHTRRRPLSENALLAALRRMGYAKGDMTPHGFRSMASTLLNEQGWNRDAIERQLAHAERDSVRAAYNFAEHLPERRKMMQAYADYLDQLEAESPLSLAKASGAL